VSPRPEAVAAADWWAKKLSEPVSHDLGRGAEPSSGLANAVSALVRRQRSHAEIEAFRQALADEIEQHLTEHSWLPDDPHFGSYMRSVGVGYGPDDVLSDAAEKAGFDLKMLDLPVKTVMWINPGVVKVAQGHGASITVIWGADR